MRKIIFIALICAVSEACGQIDTVRGIVSFSTWHRKNIYLDTIPESYSWNDPLTLKEEYTKKRTDSKGNTSDTCYQWNHFEYLCSVVCRNEIEYWTKVLHSTGGIAQKIDARDRINYWSGVRDGLQMLLNRQYVRPYLAYDFKTYKSK